MSLEEIQSELNELQEKFIAAQTRTEQLEDVLERCRAKNQTTKEQLAEYQNQCVLDEVGNTPAYAGLQRGIEASIELDNIIGQADLASSNDG